MFHPIAVGNYQDIKCYIKYKLRLKPCSDQVEDPEIWHLFVHQPQARV